MIVVAELDLSESGRKPGLPESATKVLVYSDDEHDVVAAMLAIWDVRLIREGHVFKTEILHSVGSAFPPSYPWKIVNGEAVPR